MLAASIAAATKQAATTRGFPAWLNTPRSARWLFTHRRPAPACDRCGLVGVVVLERQRSTGEDWPAAAQRDGNAWHRETLCACWKPKHLKPSITPRPRRPCAARARPPRCRRKPTVLADEREHAGQHLVAAGAVVRVEQERFRWLRPASPGWRGRRIMLGEVAGQSWRTRGLAHHEGLRILPCAAPATRLRLGI